MISPIKVFNSWVLNGKDEGMEKNHSVAVNTMIDMLIRKSSKKFSFIDAGCGNGWVVRKFQEHSDLSEYAHTLPTASECIRTYPNRSRQI